MRKVTKANAYEILRPGKEIWVIGKKAKVVSLKETQIYYRFTSGGMGFLDMKYINPDRLVQTV